MAKQGMKRPSIKEINKEAAKPKNKQSPVPEIQGKAKTGNKKANNP